MNNNDLYNGNPAARQLQSDTESRQYLRRCNVLTYANAIERGYKAWADTCPPTTQDIQETLTELQREPETWGQHYRRTLAVELDNRMGVQTRCRTLRELEELGLRFKVDRVV